MASSRMQSTPARLLKKKPSLGVPYRHFNFWYEDGLLAEDHIKRCADRRAELFGQQQWVKIWVERWPAKRR